MKIPIGAVVLFWAIAAHAQTADGAAVYREHCAACHDNASSHAPPRAMLLKAYPETVVRALEEGTMKPMAEELSPEERRAVARYVTRKEFGKAPKLVSDPVMCRDDAAVARSAATPAWNGWGAGLANTRFQKDPGFDAADIARLKLKWAFGIPGSTISNGQPSLVNGRVYLGTASPAVYSLDAKTGCVHWVYQPSAAVRAAVTVGRPSGLAQDAAFFGDGRAYVYAVNASDGALIWKVNVETFPSAHVTGSPVLSGERLYVPISIIEEDLATNPSYECCRSRGSVVALDAATGKMIWRHYTVQEAATKRGKSRVGTQLWGPAGASVWSAPTIDAKRSVLYAATGNNHSNPPTGDSDAVIAVDLESGSRLWTTQVTPKDAYNVACVRPDKANCPDDAGPDFDFGSPPILVSLPGGKRALVAGQKSGVVTALDPDDHGKILWQTRVGKGGYLGGIQWGSAADSENVYVAVSDIAWLGDRVVDPKKGGGLFALNLATGERVWGAPPPDCQGRKNCSPAQSAAISAMPGVVFSGAEDGHVRGYSTKDGKVMWDFDTAREFPAVNQVPARGGTMDGPGPAIAGGMVFVPSGYGVWGGLSGNVLLAFSVDGK